MPLISIKLDVDDKTFQQAIQRMQKSLGQLDDRRGDFVPSFDVSNLPGALRQGQCHAGGDDLRKQLRKREVDPWLSQTRQQVASRDTMRTCFRPSPQSQG